MDQDECSELVWQVRVWQVMRVKQAD